MGRSFTNSPEFGPAFGAVRVAAAVTYVLQRGGGDFTDLQGSGRAHPAWCVSAVASGRHPSLAVEDALQVVLLLPPSGSMVAWCALSCLVRSAIVYDGGGWSLPRGGGAAAPCLRRVLYGLVGLAASTMVIRRW